MRSKAEVRRKRNSFALPLLNARTANKITAIKIGTREYITISKSENGKDDVRVAITLLNHAPTVELTKSESETEKREKIYTEMIRRDMAMAVRVIIGGDFFFILTLCFISYNYRIVSADN